MNVLFVYPKPNQQKHIRYGFSLNVAYASSILKQKGFSSYLIDLSVENVELDEIVRFIKNKEIQVVFVEFDSFALNRSANDKNGIDVLRYIKAECPNVIKIAFGYECVLEKKNVEYADITLDNDLFLSMINLEDVLKQSKKYTSKTYEFDSIPFPDRDLIETVAYYKKNRDSTLIQTSRGCLNNCTFCQRRGWQDRVQFHSDEYVYKEMSIIKNRGYKNIWIQDENFTFNLKRAKRILKRFIEHNVTNEMKIAISSWTKIDKEFLELAALANIKIISMGIESANQDVLKYYKKEINLEAVKNIVSYADSLGIFTVGNFIIGAPMEKLDMINNTFSFIKDSGFDQVNIKTLDFMIGSRLYESLPRDKYPNSHYFCCIETGLGQLPLKELHTAKENFIAEYRTQFSSRLKKKILRCGTPYDNVDI